MVGPPSGLIARRADMFENAEKNGRGRTMKIIWIVLAVAAVILAIVSFA